jgi:proline iminopeptidase
METQLPDPNAADGVPAMPAFSAHDGTKLAYDVFGDGPPVVCLPGGPTDSAYLGDLGGLSALLAHCAGANPAALYLSRHPEKVSKLALITPSVRAVGPTITGDLRLETAQLRRNEP